MKSKENSPDARPEEPFHEQRHRREDTPNDRRAQDENRREERDSGNGEHQPKKPPLYKKPAFLISAAVVLIILIIGGVIFWLHARQYTSTDDAYIDGHATQVSPRVAALTVALHVDDNQLVHKGDLLVELDPTDYQLALDQATAEAGSSRARAGQAAAQVQTARAQVAQAAAEVDAAQVRLENANRDLKRYEEVDERARSRQQLDAATTAQKNAQAELAQAKARKTSADAGVVSAEAAQKVAAAGVQSSEAAMRRAQVNLSYCRIYAPTDGRVTQRTVEVGNYVAIGQAMLILVDPNVWVTANFKETQLTHMSPGQPVTIKVDAFPGTTWQGHIDSIQAGSGSRFSVLPAENATGNFVKVVQRVPVKIVFDEPVTRQPKVLSPGMSVIPKVKVR
jgi:membrane fusion protein, multidrug efflux system